jgi:hypothetical protein
MRGMQIIKRCAVAAVAAQMRCNGGQLTNLSQSLTNTAAMPGRLPQATVFNHCDGAALVAARMSTLPELDKQVRSLQASAVLLRSQMLPSG